MHKVKTPLKTRLVLHSFASKLSQIEHVPISYNAHCYTAVEIWDEKADSSIKLEFMVSIALEELFSRIILLPQSVATSSFICQLHLISETDKPVGFFVVISGLTTLNALGQAKDAC
jgi:hypothetical protein